MMSVMSVEVNAPKKRKNASKKSKKSWRKNTDVDDIQDFLEDQRLEERLGGKFEDRPDEALFTLDKTGQKEEDAAPESAKRRRRRERAEKPLKCFSNLEIVGGVPDPIKARNRVKTPFERQNPIVTKKLQRDFEAGIVKPKIKKARADRLMSKLKKNQGEAERKTRRRTEFDFDLWGDIKTAADSKVAELKSLKQDEWLNTETKKHTLQYTRRLERKLPENFLEKTSKLPAVELPEAGTSYNPSLDDHREVLWKAAVVEINKEKAKRKIERQTDMLFPDKKDAPTQESILKEMSEGISQLEDKSSQNVEEEEPEEKEDDSSSEDEQKSTVKPKTKKMRRKEKESNVNLKRKNYERSLKARNREIFRLKSIKKEIIAKEALTEERKKKNAIKKEMKKYQPSQLSAMKYEEPEIPVKLTDELTGNLRSLKPEGSVLEDRFKSLQKRNVIETRVGTNGILKRKKRKKYEKRSYKMPYELKKGNKI